MKSASKAHDAQVRTSRRLVLHAGGELFRAEGSVFTSFSCTIRKERSLHSALVGARTTLLGKKVVETLRRDAEQTVFN